MELDFLTIADGPDDLKPMRDLLTSFEGERGIKVAYQRVGWDRAWQVLLMDAVEGKGPHVSMVGSTWVPTLAMLEALRAFREEDVEALGGASRFLPAAWASVKVANRAVVWAVPWSIYSFVLYYRRDMLDKAGLDPAAAFATPAAMRETFIRLRENGFAPWAFPSMKPNSDLLHIASSWARANGGDFLSADGREAMFAKPEVRSGLAEFFELFPFLPPALRGLSAEGCARAFARGDAATMIGGVEVGGELVSNPETAQAVRENLAATTLPGVPWIGGDHLAVWKGVLANPEEEEAALAMVKFLSAKETQVKLFEAQTVLPARADAYDQLTFPLETTGPTLQTILQTGRPHPSLPLWRRIEAFLNEMILDIGSTILRQPSLPASETATRMLDAYAQKLTAVIKG